MSAVAPLPRRPSPPGGAPRPRGVTLIIVYKFTKATAQVALAGVVALLIGLGLAARLQAFAGWLHAELGGEWSQRLAALIVGASDHLWLITLALAFDGVLSSIEGLALYRRYRWGPWLVVVTTSALLPFEVAELLRGVQPTRAAMFVINVAIVIYLARRAMAEASGHPSHTTE